MQGLQDLMDNRMPVFDLQQVAIIVILWYNNKVMLFVQLEPDQRSQFIVQYMQKMYIKTFSEKKIKIFSIIN